MAKKKTPRPVNKQKGEKRKRISKFVILVLLMATVLSSPATVVLLSFTSLPTLLAWFAERRSDRLAWVCVGGFNFSGIIPYLFFLWFGSNTVGEALDMASSGGVFFFAYSSSAIGWAAYRYLPPIVAKGLIRMSARRSATLKIVQEKLIADWGDEVCTRKSTSVVD